jgi:hypothetical protein
MRNNLRSLTNSKLCAGHHLPVSRVLRIHQEQSSCEWLRYGNRVWAAPEGDAKILIYGMPHPISQLSFGLPCLARLKNNMRPVLPVVCNR